MYLCDNVNLRTFIWFLRCYRDLDTAISLRMLAGKVSVIEGCFCGDASYGTGTKKVMIIAASLCRFCFSFILTDILRLRLYDTRSAK